jgi:predicted RNA-binding protein (virulence factor B family)
MLKAGKKNYLQIIQLTDHGAYLDGGDNNKILLPRKYVPRDFQPGDWLDVFVYYDSEDRIIATTRQPYAEVGQFAYLKVVDVNPTGAFLDWGLEKDLLVPYQEQITRLKKGNSYTVYIYLDRSTKRITATTKIDRHLKETNDKKYRKDDTVDIMIWRQTEIGYSVIIDNEYLGLLYKNELFRPVRYGQKLKGFVKSIRADDKIDITLNKGKKQTSDALTEVILHYLENNNGVSSITDKSNPETIYAEFKVSKANFKRAVGRLLKAGKITVGKQQIRLTEK